MLVEYTLAVMDEHNYSRKVLPRSARGVYHLSLSFVQITSPRVAYSGELRSRPRVVKS